jgi:hypothetical protein
MESKHKSFSIDLIWVGFFVWVSAIPLDFIFAFDNPAKSALIESISFWGGLFLIVAGVYAKRKGEKYTNSNTAYGTTPVSVNTNLTQTNERGVQEEIQIFNRLKVMWKIGVLLWILIFFPLAFTLESGYVSRVVDYAWVAYLLVLPVFLVCLLFAHVYRQRDINKAVLILKLPKYFLVFSTIFLIMIKFLISMGAMNPCGRTCEENKNFNKEIDAYAKSLR